MDSCGKISKALLVMFNFVILCAGIAALAVGIYTLVEKNDFEELIGSQMYTSGAYALIVAGSVVVIMSFFGCMGALKEYKCMLVTFFIFLFLIFALLLAASILGYVFRGEVETSLKQTMNSTLLENYGIDVKSTDDSSESVKNVAATDAWNFIQKEFSCCAIGNFTTPKDWQLWGRSKWCLANDEPQNLPRPPATGTICVPNSCCGKATLENGGPGCEMSEIHRTGCYHAGYDFLYTHAAIIGGIGIGIACSLIIGMLLVICLYRQIEM